ncbi:MAG: ATP-binding protein [Dehalococcoidales bacterium]|nr:ATP-binding protein [Dehalococcoidales bacterium]
MADDLSILTAAYEREHDPRRPERYRHWESRAVGADKNDVRRLLQMDMIHVEFEDYRLTKYKLTAKGNEWVQRQLSQHSRPVIPAAVVLDAMSLLVGHDDLKLTIAKSIENRKRANFLLEGPPACGKSVLIDAVRSVVPDSYLAFGRSVSAAGLSDVLFEQQPGFLLLDEIEKMPPEAREVLLGVMETGEILETKSRRSRGIKLATNVIAACNSSVKFTPEFLSRFALHAHFPPYSREQFIEVCISYLSQTESCPADMAGMIGQRIYDGGLGDVRKARSVWQFMQESSEGEMARVINMMHEYAPAKKSEKQSAMQPMF